MQDPEMRVGEQPRLFVYDQHELMDASFDIDILAPGQRVCTGCSASGQQRLQLFEGGSFASDLCNYAYGNKLPLPSSHALAGIAYTNNEQDTDFFHIVYRLRHSSKRVDNARDANVFFIPVPFYQIKHQPYTKRYADCGLEFPRANWTLFLDRLDKSPHFWEHQGRDHFVVLTKPFVWAKTSPPFKGHFPGYEHVQRILQKNVVKLTHWGISKEQSAMPMPFDTFIHIDDHTNLRAVIRNIFHRPRPNLVAYIGGLTRGYKPGPYAGKLANWEAKRMAARACVQSDFCHTILTDTPESLQAREGALLANAGAHTHIGRACLPTTAPSNILRHWDSTAAEERLCAYPQLLNLDTVFCLTPPGDAPSRRGTFEALLLGCIPIFFNPLTAQYPWYWKHLRFVGVHMDQRVLANVSTFESALKEIPASEIDRLQQSIRRRWSKLQYSYNDTRSDDAVDVVLKRMVRWKSRDRYPHVR